jgi:hypothetical protein
MGWRGRVCWLRVFLEVFIRGGRVTVSVDLGYLVWMQMYIRLRFNTKEVFLPISPLTLLQILYNLTVPSFKTVSQDARCHGAVVKQHQP